jgi:hypothetical protein
VAQRHQKEPAVLLGCRRTRSSKCANLRNWLPRLPTLGFLDPNPSNLPNPPG